MSDYDHDKGITHLTLVGSPSSTPSASNHGVKKWSAPNDQVIKVNIDAVWKSCCQSGVIAVFLGWEGNLCGIYYRSSYASLALKAEVKVAMKGCYIAQSLGFDYVIETTSSALKGFVKNEYLTVNCPLHLVSDLRKLRNLVKIWSIVETSENSAARYLSCTILAEEINVEPEEMLEYAGKIPMQLFEVMSANLPSYRMIAQVFEQ